MKRWEILHRAGWGVFALGVTAPAAWAQTSPIPKGTITAKLTASGTLSANDGTPQDLVSAPGDAGRAFVAGRNGTIRILNNGALSSTPFLTLSAAGVSVYTGGEGGLLGLAFSPNFATDRKFYTLETEPFSTANAADFSHPELFPTTATNPNNQTLLREWTASTANPNVANTTSRVLMRINHSQSNHQGGALRFGPDGYLYLSIGDGGGANDFNGSATSTTDGHTNSIGNGQDTTVPMGKVMRIDPNGNNSANGQYGIPATNPFASGVGGMKEIYAYGFRNPYKVNFDRVTGKLYVGDVGQGAREEVDTITLGGNYGWPFREGTRDNSADAGRTTPAGFTSLLPIAEYTHGDGDAIVGGMVYRGTLMPDLVGKYVFGDYQGTAATSGSKGRLFYTDAAGGPIFELKYDATGITPPSGLIALGENAGGEIYAMFDNGSIVNVTGVPEPGAAAGLILAAASGTVLRRRRQSGLIAPSR